MNFIKALTFKKLNVKIIHFAFEFLAPEVVNILKKVQKVVHIMSHGF
jgi:hypothetical protein